MSKQFIEDLTCRTFMGDQCGILLSLATIYPCLGPLISLKRVYTDTMDIVDQIRRATLTVRSRSPVYLSNVSLVQSDRID
jgi:hypothetical protein